MVKKVPAIRFKGFSKDWEQRKLGEMAEKFKSGMNIKAEYIYETGNFPVYGGNDVRGYTDTYNHDGEFALIGRQGALSGNMNYSIGKAYFTEHAVAVKANKENDTKFLFYLMSKLKLGRWVTQSAQPGLTVGTLIEIKSLVPNKDEQEKTSRFLTKLDGTIALHQHALDLLKLRKKAFLQKMFPKKRELVPELRFSGYTEQWKVKQLKELVSYNSSKYSSNQFEDNEFDGIYPVFDANKLIAKINVYDMEEKYLSIIKDGAGVGRFSRRPAKSSIIGTMGYLSSKKSNIDFLYALLQKFEFRKYIVGSTIPHVYFKDYGIVKLQVPSLEEQTKIGNFFNQLDNSITLQEQKLESLKQMKKAFLQKIFV